MLPRSRALLPCVPALLVSLSLSLPARAAEPAPGGAGGHATLEAVNGSLELRLPAQTDGKLDISTVSGKITSDFPLERREQMVGAQAAAVLGAGGAAMQLSTVNGAIRIAKR